MPAEEITFRVAYDGPLTDFSRRLPDAALSLWCDWRREVVEVIGASPDDVTALKDALAPHSPWLEAYPLDDATHVLLLDCVGLPHDFVNEAVDEARCLNMAPTRFESGWEVYRVVSFDESHSRGLMKRVRESGREVELLTKRPLRVQPLLNTRNLGVGTLFDGLTDRQAEALLLAYRHGLYGSPRRTTAASIAEALDLSRSTYEEHVRKAEGRVMANLVPYLELFVKARKAAREAAPAGKA